MEKNQRKRLILKAYICISAIILAATAIVIYITVILPRPTEGQKNVTLIIAYQNKEYKYENLITEELYVLGLLTEYNNELELGLEYETSEFGAFITELKETANDSANGCFYTYSINGEDANFGVSMQPISNGDIIMFSYSRDVWAQDGEDWVLVSSELAEGGNNTALSRKNERNTLLIIVLSAVGVTAAAGIFLAVSHIVALKNGKNTNTSEK